MPIVAVLPAVAATAFAIATPTIFTIAAAVGAVAGAVGAIAGIKELQIAGTVVGAIGAIGGLASSAGLLDGFMGAADAASDAAGGVSAVAGPAGGYQVTLDTATGLTQTYAGGVELSLPGFAEAAGAMSSGAGQVSGPATTDIVDEVTGQIMSPEQLYAQSGTTGADNIVVDPEAVVPEVTPQAAVEPTQAQTSIMGEQVSGADAVTGAPAPDAATNVPSTGAAPAGTQAPDASAVTGSVTASPTASGPVTGAPQPVSGLPIGADAGIPGSAAAAAGEAAKFPAVKVDEPGVFSNIWEFLQKPGGAMLASGLLQAGSSFIAGATSGLTPAQIAALEAQAKANNAAANLGATQERLLNRRMELADQPASTATSGGGGIVARNAPPPSTGFREREAERQRKIEEEKKQQQSAAAGQGLINRPPSGAAVTGRV